MKTKFYFLWSSLILCACGEEFDPYYKIENVRILGVQASPPTLFPGETSTIKPLVYNSTDSTLAYQWSWCPLSSGSSDSYECSVAYEDLVQQLPKGFSILPYDLGQTEEIDFVYPVPASLVDAFCESLVTQSENLPDFVELPSCTYGLPVYVTLSITDENSNKVISVKKVNLATSQEQENQNPSPPKIYISSNRGDKVEMTQDKIVYLQREADYELQAEIDSTSSEVYVDENEETQEESLIVSWFIESGELESTRTGYYPNQNTLEDLKNKFKTPSLRDYESNQIKMYVVVRDNRQGMSYREFDLRLE